MAVRTFGNILWIIAIAVWSSAIVMWITSDWITFGDGIDVLLQACVAIGLMLIAHKIDDMGRNGEKE